jgi:alanyl-tRNA synthetase
VGIFNVLTRLQAGGKAGMSSNEWAGKVSAVVGGKPFGKAPTSYGSGTGTKEVEEALKAATAYLEGFKL